MTPLAGLLEAAALAFHLVAQQQEQALFA